jgi:hypothetical protein
MKKKVRLTESDLVHLIKKILKEQVSAGPLKRFDKIKVMANLTGSEDILTFMITDVTGDSITIMGADDNASRYGYVEERKMPLNLKALSISGLGDIISINDKQTLNGKVLSKTDKPKPKVAPKKIQPQQQNQPKPKTKLVKLLSKNDPKIVLMQIQPNFKVIPDAPDSWVIEAKTDRNKPIDLYFKCNPQGPEYTFIHSWEGTDGFKGRGQLIFDDQTLFGNYCRFKG